MTSASPTAAPGDLAAGACLAHRRVLVVGGGQQDYGQPDPPVGIGRAIARLCAREGATVAVLDRDRDAAERSAAEIRAAGSRAIALHADASDDDALGAAVDGPTTSSGASTGSCWRWGSPAASGSPGPTRTCGIS